MLATDVPARGEIVRRVADVAAAIREKVAWQEEHRRLHDDTIDLLAEAGVFRLRTPRRHGGYEADTRTLIEVGAELGKADGATAWTAAVYWIPTWMASLFPDQVQDEVFATPDVRICGTLSPTAMAAPAGGGVVVNGKWSFITGALHSHWQEIIAVLVDGEHEPMPIVALVPLADLTVVDDWHTSGLRGTGSVSTLAADLFVPQERVLPLPNILNGQSATGRNADSPIYRAPLLPVASASSAGTALGLARAALDVFTARMHERKITYTDYQKQSEAPLTHLQLAEATLKTEEIEFHTRALAGLVDEKAATGADWTVPERVRARAEMGMSCRLAKEVVDSLAAASGGSSIYQDAPMQRIARDVQAMNLHALMHPNTNAELYGRVLSGLAPNTLYF